MPSLLDSVTIQNPCTADWNAMTGDDRVRRCGDCKLNVYNVAEMTRDDAEALITASEGERVCMRLSVRPDGTLVTADCLTVAQRLRRRFHLIAAAFIGLLGFGTATLAGDVSESGGLNSWETWQKQPFKGVSNVLPEDWVPQEPQIVMGDICIPTVAPVPSTGTNGAGVEDDG
jgi:hypothetical protein